MKNKKLYVAKVLTVAACLLAIIGIIAWVVYSPSSGSDLSGANSSNTSAGTVTTVLAASDFQHIDGNEAGQAIIESIVSAMVAQGQTEFDGFLFCGDYAHHTYGVVEETVEGIKAIKESVSSVVTENMVFIQGNHDASLDTEGLSPSGENDPEHGNYGVFVLHNNDYMWHNDNEAVIKRSAQRLTEYLNEKLVLSYDKPIFVLSHLPLHYSMRTKFDGDKMYANYIFDVLNEAGAKGLNIIFLFGHDHSNGWDDYLGGSCIYLAKGEEILIAQASQTEFKAETLNFTYLNPGYVGYYTNHNGADDTLSMTAFTITDSEVTVTRYSDEGEYLLKAKGVRNSYRGESEYEPTTNEYASPQTITLTKVRDNSLLKNVIEEPAEGVGGKYVKITSQNQIKDGERYLLVYNASSSLIMLPETVTKENSNGVKRIGMGIESTVAFETSTVYGDFAGKEFSFEKADGGWKIKCDKGYVKFTRTNDCAITATFENDGDIFTIGGAEDAFTFSSGSIVLNYNSRGLINGYESNPATFSIYRLEGYTVNVTNGKANKQEAVKGDVVSITADKAPKGKVFNGWVVISGEITISDANSEKTQFTMPDGEVRIVATYADKD